MERAELAERRQELEIEDGILERDYRFFDRVQGTEFSAVSIPQNKESIPELMPQK